MLIFPGASSQNNKEIRLINYLLLIVFGPMLSSGQLRAVLDALSAIRLLVFFRQLGPDPQLSPQLPETMNILYFCVIFIGFGINFWGRARIPPRPLQNQPPGPRKHRKSNMFSI